MKIKCPVIYLFLLLSICLSSPLHAQKKPLKTNIVAIEQVKILEYPDWEAIVARKTGGKDVEKLGYRGATDSCYLVSFPQEGNDRGRYTNKFRVVRVAISEANDTIVSFLSDYLFCKVDKHFYDDLLEVAICDTINNGSRSDLLHISGKVLGDFKYSYLSDYHSDVYNLGNEYEDVPRFAFKNGLARVELIAPTNKYGTYLCKDIKKRQKRSFMDLTGRIITDSLFYDIYPFDGKNTYYGRDKIFDGDLAIVSIFDENLGQAKYGCIDRDGNLSIPLEYLSIKPFDSDFVLAKSWTKPGRLLDRQGETLVEGVSLVRKHSDSVWLILGSDFNEYSFYFNPKTRKKLSQEYLWVGSSCCELPHIVGFTNGLPEAHIRGHRHIATYGLVDVEGNEILPVIYDGFSFYNQYRLALVEKEDKVAWVNEKGKIITEWFDRLNKFEEPGVAWVRRNEKWTLINLNGEIISNWFDNIWNFSEGLSRVQVNNRIGCVDQSGAMVIEPKYIEMEAFKNGYAIVRFEGDDENKKGVINSKGELVIPVDSYKDNDEIEIKLKEL